MDLERAGHLKVLPVCGCCMLCLALIFACFAVPMSFASLNQGFYALQLNWQTQQIGDDVVIEPGMKQVGLGNMLVNFPSTFQTMHFKPGGIRGPIRARSSDGLETTLSVSFQFRFAPHSLKPMYSILGDHLYLDEFVRFARASIVDSCTVFRAEQFFTMRTLITEQMLTDLKKSFNLPAIDLDVGIMGLQLGVVDLPDAFEGEIQKMMAAQQEVEIAKAERQEKRIIKDRELMVATLDVEKKIEIAKGEAERVRLSNEATVAMIKVQTSAKADSNNLILSQFMNDADPYGKLLDVMELRMLESHDSGKIMVNM